MAGSDIIPRTIADDINVAHAEAEHYRDSAVETAGKACRAAIRCGELLAKAKAEHPGEFLLWLEANCQHISESTAKRYMRVAEKNRSAVADASLDFKTLKELYIACGIMPEPEGKEPQEGEKLPSWVRWTLRADALIDKLGAEEKAGLRTWCQTFLQRLV